MEEFVVGVDGSDESRLALRWAASVAERARAQLRIVTAWTYPALGVLRPKPEPLAPAEDMDAQALEALDAQVKQELGDVPPFVSTQVLRGPAAGALLRTVAPDGVVVLGSRGRGGFAGLVLGSVSRECVEHAPCPVVIVQHERSIGRSSGPIIVGEDGSANGTRALKWALELRDHVGGDVVAAHAWTAQMSEVRPTLRDRLASQAHAGVTARVADHDVEVVEIEGDPREELVDLATKMDASMLVVGRRGESRLRGIMLGGVSTYLVSNSPTTIAVIPPPPDN
ncbi:MAG TPA: universal stress protein [Acidimicrobiia bacterium]|jgi:nucleotide-binding universal stress UspA family protein